MKKILFCAGLVALATSCTQDETISLDVQNQKNKGITFEIVEKADSRVQYDQDENKAWNPFWYAEQDRIAIWANGVGFGALTPATGDTIDGTYWKDFVGSTATSPTAYYKATSSTNKANWTAVNDDNMLNFVKSDKKGAKFLAVYPYVAGSSLTLAGESVSGTDVNDTLIVAGALDNLSNQTIKTAKGWNDKIVMVAGAARTQDEVFESVGEKMALAFSHATPVMKFGTKGLTADYQKAFGNLKKITVKTLGYDKNADGDWADAGDIKPSPLYYTNGAIQVTDSANWKAEYVSTTAVPADSTTNNSIVVTIGSVDGLAWSDAALAPVAVAPTKRSNYGTNGERITADFEFANITIQVEKKNVTKDCVVGKNFQAITLDMADYAYLVTNADATTNLRTLFVNSGDFSGIIKTNADGDTLGIDWAAATNGTVAFNEIGTIVVAKEVVLDAADFKVMNKMIAATNLTLKGNTTIPEAAMNEMSELHTIDLPLVTSVGVGAFDADSLVTVKMPAYKFNEAANACLLDTVNLVTLEMGADAMNAGFPKTGLTLKGYTKLETVKVNDGIELGPNAFAGCTSLKTVTGKVNVTGTDVFNGCTVLDKVVLANTNIPAGTFTDCIALKNVYYGSTSTALVPVEIGNAAFKNTKVNLDLTATTVIGDNAFEGVTTLVGKKYSSVNPQIVLTVSAATIGKEAFKSTAMTLVEFTGATEIHSGIFTGNGVLEEIKFVKAFTCPKDNPALTTFGTTPANTKLFVAKGQTGVQTDSKTLKIGNATKETSITFLSITKAAQ